MTLAIRLDPSLPSPAVPSPASKSNRAARHSRRGRNPRLRLPLLAAALLAAAACGGNEGRPSAPSTSLALAPRAVATARVEASPAGVELVPGAVHARESATLAARGAGAVMALPVREGEAVTRGEIVVRLDTTALRAAAAAAQAALQAAEADAARLQSLAEAHAATPREVEAATARAAASRAAAEAARDAIAYAELRSPFAGTVTALHVEVGDVVLPGRPLVDVQGGGGFEVRAAVPARLASGLARGGALPCRVDGAGTLTATVRTLSDAADPVTQRLDLRADLPAAPGLRAGAFARLEVPSPGANGERTLRVPSAALFEHGGLTGLFVANAGKAELRWVAIGERTAEWTEIRSGVGAGDAVVLSPGDLADGQPITETPATSGAAR